MLGLFGVAILILGIAAIFMILRRSPLPKPNDLKPVAQAKPSLAYAVVSKEESQAVPYPIVYVNDDESVRELHPDEREYLETPFHPADGGRPYIKGSFEAEDGWGKRGGFCPRSKIPHSISTQDAPAQNPTKPLTKEGLMEFLREKGLAVTENADGTVSAMKQPGAGS